MAGLSLWDDVGAVYARPGVKAACLTLQDAHGQCVSYLLWAGWTATRGRFPAADVLAEAAGIARGYEEAALRPRRTHYAALKAAGAGAEALKAELDAMLEDERLLLADLEALTPDAGAAIAGLEALIQAAEAWSPHPAPINLLATLADAFSSG